ncbi:MAG TPA: phosphoglucosamine mutase [Parvularcula sp.]|nr:phosphoglucosamine mutase [Parvularcula sp.]
MRGDEGVEPAARDKGERKIFGTDGVRGLANAGAMTPESILRLGMAVGRYFRNGDHRHRVVIGKDTRLSGYMIEPALTAGFAASGIEVFLLGPLPTPAMAMLTRSMRADLGVMISASHNPYHDNGVKFFGPDGYKLSDAAEIEIERLMGEGGTEALAAPADLGRVKRIDDAGARYIEFAKNAFPRGLSLEGLRVVIDCANGAAYKVAPTVLWELGADIRKIGVEPNGFNINQDCGSTAPKALQQAVIDYRADIGIALDGDADRVAIVDEKGRLVQGDQILALIARFLQSRGKLKGGAVVSTVMANYGLERYLAELGVKLDRTKVGDRYVVEAMRAKGANVGGEPSGHVILSDYSTTGDGLVTALQALAVIAGEKIPASAAFNCFTPTPQFNKNVKIDAAGLVSDPLSDPGVKAAIAAAEQRLSGAGRIVIRKSGTEPLIRVMAEGEDRKLVAAIVDELCAVIEKAAR